MLNPEEALRTEAQESRLPWHRPEVRQLHVALDTRNEINSGEDGGTLTDIVMDV